MSLCGPDPCNGSCVSVTSAFNLAAGTSSDVHGDAENLSPRESFRRKKQIRSLRRCLRPKEECLADNASSERINRGSQALASLKNKIMKAWADAYSFWRKVRGDRFRWGLFKSMLMFTVGLKLFNDLARHMAKDAKPCGTP